MLHCCTPTAPPAVKLHFVHTLQVYLEAALQEAEKQFVQEQEEDMSEAHAAGKKVQGESAWCAVC